MSKLLDLFNKTVDELNAFSDNAEEIEFFLTNRLIPEVLALPPGETPPDVREFFNDWDTKHREARQSMDEEGPELKSHQEEMEQHVRSHKSSIFFLEAIYNWILEKTPKSVPPTIVYYALDMYNRAIASMRACMAETLYGDELNGRPDPDEGPDFEEPGEDDAEPV